MLEDLGDPLPAWCTFTVREGSRLADGGALADAVTTVGSSRSVVAIGVNCSAPAAALEAVASIALTTPLPIVAYPNRGANWDPDAKAWTGGEGSDMVVVATDLVTAGARLVGGCCGTGPDDVRAIAMAVGTRPRGARG